MMTMSNKNCLTEKQDARTALRLPRQLRQRIDQLIEEGKFETLSAVIRAALEQFLRD
jgi:Arc/MetJ-type ribon-helix-helix transcriptional regulator